MAPDLSGPEPNTPARVRVGEHRGDAEEDRKPQLPPVLAPAEPPVAHVKPAPFTPAFFGACLITLVWTVVLLGFIVARTSVAASVTATLAAAIGAIAALIGIFQPQEKPKIGPKITRGIVAAILIADFGVSAGWVSWSCFQAHRSIDVRSMVALNRNIDVMPGSHTALDVAVTAQRRTIVLVFQVVDHNGSIGDCVPSTLLGVTPDMTGNRGETVNTSPGVPTSVDLPAGITKLHLDIEVTNTRGDQNCSVDLSVASAKLQN
jgi:hypothetical protein